jgi:hypothetical protein
LHEQEYLQQHQAIISDRCWKYGIVNYASKGTGSGMFKFLKGVDKAGAPEGIWMGNAKMIGAQGATDAGIKAAELNEDALAKYNAELAATRYQ